MDRAHAEVRERYLGAKEKIMSIPESCVGAARAPGDFELQNPHAEARARRVLKAASKCVPNEVVDAHIRVYWLLPPDHDIEILFPNTSRLAGERARVRAALSAGLAKWAEGE
jgi:hypothetical protein